MTSWLVEPTNQPIWKNIQTYYRIGSCPPGKDESENGLVSTILNPGKNLGIFGVKVKNIWNHHLEDLDENGYPSSRNHGSMKNGSRFHSSYLSNAAIFHWTMIMGERVRFLHACFDKTASLKYPTQQEHEEMKQRCVLTKSFACKLS